MTQEGNARVDYEQVLEVFKLLDKTFKRLKKAWKRRREGEAAPAETSPVS